MEQDSFLFYRSFYESLSGIPDKERLKVYDAICKYALNGEVVKLDGISNSIMILIKPLLEANYKRKTDGSKGGRPNKKPVVTENKTSGFENEITSGFENEKPNKEKDKDKEKDIDKDIKEKSQKETAEAVVNLYHECCPSLPKVSKLNPMRIKLANARLKDYTMDELKAIFIKAENSTFLKEGQGTWNGANFDWILNQTNICKIEDGYYSNGEEKNEPEETREAVGYILNEDKIMVPCYDREELERYKRERDGK